MGKHDDIDQPFKNGNSVLTLILVLFFAVFAGGALTYAIARPHFWLHAENARVTFAGENLENENVYRSSGGMILIRLPHPNGVPTEYIYYSSMEVLAVADANEFSYRDRVAFAKSSPPRVDSYNIRARYNDPTLVVGKDAFEFKTDEGLVRIEMAEPLKPDIPHNYF